MMKEHEKERDDLKKTYYNKSIQEKLRSQQINKEKEDIWKHRINTATDMQNYKNKLEVNLKHKGIENRTNINE